MPSSRTRPEGIRHEGRSGEVEGWWSVAIGKRGADGDWVDSAIVDETVLPGGVGNAGLVVQVGDTVRRPWHPSTPATHALLTYLHDVLPGVAPRPLGRDEQGREVLSFLPGEVAVDPFPVWATNSDYLI